MNDRPFGPRLSRRDFGMVSAARPPAPSTGGSDAERTRSLSDLKSAS
jgi:hypothetical protein